MEWAVVAQKNAAWTRLPQWAPSIHNRGVRPPRRHVMKQWLLLGGAILAEVVATSSLKASDGFSKLLPSIVVVIGYAVAFYLLSLTLKTLPVGIAYAAWSGLGIVLIALIGWLVFGQKLDMPAIAGMALIIAGVLVMNVFSKAGAH
jgi:small multidrug resistance pump